jgi:hypothetical protein
VVCLRIVGGLRIAVCLQIVVYPRIVGGLQGEIPCHPAEERLFFLRCLLNLLNSLNCFWILSCAWSVSLLFAFRTISVIPVDSMILLDGVRTQLQVFLCCVTQPVLHSEEGFP